MSTTVQVTCDGCGRTRQATTLVGLLTDRTEAKREGWRHEPGTAPDDAGTDHCPACLDDLAHGRPPGSDAFLGGLADGAPMTTHLAHAVGPARSCTR